MKKMILVFTTLFALLSAICARSDQSCNAQRNIYKGNTSGDGTEKCYCGKELNNISMSLPAPLKLIAACALYRWPNNGLEKKPIDLSKEKISLNNLPPKTNAIEGIFYIQGRTTIAASTRFEHESEADLESNGPFVVPKQPLTSPKNELLSSYLRGFHVSDELRLGKPKKTIKRNECYGSDFQIEINGLIIEADDSDLSGTFAIDPKVSKS